jgi:hypothetical protein
MFLIQIFKGMFFKGGPIGTTDRNQAAIFTDRDSAQKYAKDIDGSRIIEDKRRKK